MPSDAPWFERYAFATKHPYVWRAIGSLLLALPIAFLMIGIADGAHLLTPLLYLLSPGYVLGLRAMDHARGSVGLEPLGIFGRTAISANLIYWSSILFGFFSLRARAKNPN